MGIAQAIKQKGTSGVTHMRITVIIVASIRQAALSRHAVWQRGRIGSLRRSSTKSEYQRKTGREKSYHDHDQHYARAIFVEVLVVSKWAKGLGGDGSK